MKFPASAKLFLFFVLAAASGFPSAVRAEDAGVRYHSWITYWDVQKSTTAWHSYGAGVDQLSVFAAFFNPNGDLYMPYSNANQTVKLIRKEHPGERKILLTIVNDVKTDPPRLKDSAIIHDILTDPDRRTRHINRILTLTDGFDGVEIDYENLRILDRGEFTAFIADLAEKLHAQEKILVVDLEPKSSEVAWNGAGAADWSALARNTDLLQVMGYYQHFPGGLPGPVAEVVWLKDIVHYGLKKIPREKFCLVLAMNGVEWSRFWKGRTIDYPALMSLAESHQSSIVRTRKDDIPSFSYKAPDGSYTIWFDDDASLTRKVEALKRLGVLHIGLWRLGTGDPAFWSRIADDR